MSCKCDYAKDSKNIPLLLTFTGAGLWCTSVSVMAGLVKVGLNNNLITDAGACLFAGAMPDTLQVGRCLVASVATRRAAHTHTHTHTHTTHTHDSTQLRIRRAERVTPVDEVRGASRAIA